MYWKDCSFEFKVGIILLGVVVLLLALATQNITIPWPSLTELFYIGVFIFIIEWLSLPFMVSKLNKKMGELIKLQITANETSGNLLESIGRLRSALLGHEEASRNNRREP